jgi:hypothetical protein
VVSEKNDALWVKFRFSVYLISNEGLNNCRRSLFGLFCNRRIADDIEQSERENNFSKNGGLDKDTG